MSKISIVIPAYIKNQTDLSYLKESFDRIVKQSFTDYEVVVSDNSTNELVENLCNLYQNKFSLIYKKNLDHIGMSANSNVAMD